MLIFGFGITTDVDNLSFRVLDRDNTPESRAYLEEIRGSPYFTEKAPLKNAEEQQRALKTGIVNATIEIPPGSAVTSEPGVAPKSACGWTAPCRSARRPCGNTSPAFIRVTWTTRC